MSREESREEINDFLNGPGGWILTGVAATFIAVFAYRIGVQTAGSAGGVTAVLLVAAAGGGIYYWRARR